MRIYAIMRTSRTGSAIPSGNRYRFEDEDRFGFQFDDKFGKGRVQV